LAAVESPGILPGVAEIVALGAAGCNVLGWFADAGVFDTGTERGCDTGFASNTIPSVAL